MSAAEKAIQWSVVVPVYHGARTLEALHERLTRVMEELGEGFELIFVDDGSGDDSWKVIRTLAERDRRLRGILLMRNYGQANASMAGMAEASGDFVITLDDDLQHPPEEIPKLIEVLAEDPKLDMVIGVPREKHHPLWRNLASGLLNWVSRRMFGKSRSFKLTTFRLMRRQALEPQFGMNLPNPTPGAQLQTITRRTASVTVDHAPRNEGRSGYTLAKMVNKTVYKILGFSTLPLRFLALTGIAGVGLSLALGIFYLAKYLSGRIGVPGFTTLLLVLIFLSGFNFLAFGIFGEYLQQILLSVRRTPPYLVRERVTRDLARQRPRASPGLRSEPRMEPLKEFSFQELDRLAERHGGAFYLCDVDTFGRNYREFLAAFTKIYPRSRLAYSYKTNYLPLLCRRIDDWGGYAEVVSILEYELAVRIGVEPRNIIFNGPCKRQHDLARTLLAGSVVNLDAAYEIPLVEAIARRNPGRELNVGLRCAFDVGTDEPTRFGFDADNGALDKAVSRLSALPGVRLGGLHCHFMPPGRTPDAYARIARRMLDLSVRVHSDLSGRFIDLGGAFFSRMPPALARQFGGDLPTFTDYGRAIATPFAEAYPNGDGPELILEPGMAIVADTMRFVARVLDVKVIGGRKTALISGSIYNILPSKSRRNMPVRRIPADGAGSPVTGPLDLVGYTCMEDDVLFRGYEGEIAAGDLVVFDSVGAYTLVLKPPFIQPAPPVLAIEGGDLSPARRAETFADLFASYELPA